MAHEIPKTMKAVFLTKPIQGLGKLSSAEIQSHFEIKEVEIPPVVPGSVLIKIARSPINPSDVSALQFHYNPNKRPTLPWTPGFEGSGTIAAVGEGVTHVTVGQRVALSAEGGLWAEYLLTKNPRMLIPLPDKVTFGVGSSSIVNPFTVISFVEDARAQKQKYIIHTAGASSLGKQLIKYSKTKGGEGVSIIATVRKADQVKELLNLGASHVFNTSEEHWEKEFSKVVRELDAKLVFDAVGGELSGKLLSALPDGGVVKVYGGLSGSNPSVSVADLIFASKKLEGHWLSKVLGGLPPQEIGKYVTAVQEGLQSGVFAIEVREVKPIEKLEKL